MTKTQKLLLGALAAPLMTLTLSAQATLFGTYEFTNNSLTATDADGSDGITLSAFNINSYTADEAFSDSDAVVADTDLDFLSLNGVETLASTGDAYAEGHILSFTITNDSGFDLTLDTLSADIAANATWKFYNSRVFDLADPTADVAGNTLTQVGFNNNINGYTAPFETFDGDLTGGSTNAPGAITIVNGASTTLYMAFSDNSTAATRYAQIDNITISGTVIPEPGTYALLAGLLGLTSVMLRRRK